MRIAPQATGVGRHPAMLPRRIAILGFARSGRSLARALLARGVEVVVGEKRSRSEFPDVAEWERRGVRFFFDGPLPEFLDGAGWLVLSPGVPLVSGPVAVARARELPVLAELEVAWRIAQNEVEGENHWIAVTGTNGKSTTTAWIGAILRSAGRPVALAGNIGVPLSEFLDDRRPRDFVCEVSSFQLESIQGFRANVAVLTNITPDHLDRYADFAEYAAAKARVFANQREKDWAVLNADDPGSAPIQPGGRCVRFSRRGPVEGGVWLEGEVLFSAVRETRREVVSVGELPVTGAANVENALAALAAADCLGVDPEAVRTGLQRFEGLPHRMELVAEAAGTRWIDDSKGTNVDAVQKSVEAFSPESIILILGGRDKHGGFAALRPAVSRAARCVLTIGEAAPLIESALAGAAPIERVGDMAAAVARAVELVRPGDTVLLSPACASFDQYANFEERGRHFARLAREAASQAMKRET